MWLQNYKDKQGKNSYLTNYRKSIIPLHPTPPSLDIILSCTELLCLKIYYYNIFLCICKRIWQCFTCKKRSLWQCDHDLNPQGQMSNFVLQRQSTKRCCLTPHNQGGLKTYDIPLFNLTSSSGFLNGLTANKCSSLSLQYI